MQDEPAAPAPSNATSLSMQDEPATPAPPDATSLLDAREAAALLGVRRATLYSYVSRGWLRSVAVSSREHRYLREDLYRLKARSDARAGHGPVAGAALRWGEPVLETAISGILEAGPVYRGHDAVALALSGVSYEVVAELLWSGALDATPSGWPCRDVGLELDLLSRWPPPDSPVDLFRLAIPLLKAAGITAVQPGEKAELEDARGLIRRLVGLSAVPAGVERVARALETPRVAESLAVALGVDGARDVAPLLDLALILSADHDLNASTLSARVAASTGADLHACLSAAMCTLSGPRHGGACARVEGLLDEASNLRAPQDVIRRRFLRGETVPGFGHRLYPHGDPRARALLEAAEARGGDRPAVRSLLAIARGMESAGHPPPALDFGLVALAEACGLPRGGAVALFAVGRMAGWVAHIQEQRRQGYLLRPTAKYVGPRGVAESAMSGRITAVVLPGRR